MNSGGQKAVANVVYSSLARARSTPSRKIANWPVGIVNCVAWLILLWISAIYLNALLQLVYIALSIYGWRNWLWGGGARDALTVRWATSAERLRAACVIGLGTLVGTQLMQLAGDVAPVWDSLTTVTSIVAIYWQGRKIYECWFLWLSVDVVYFVLYGSQDLWLTRSPRWRSERCAWLGCGTGSAR